MKKIISLIAILALGFNTGCKKKNPENITNNYYTTIPPVVDTKIALPITKGSYWVYNVDVVEVATLNRTFIEQDSIVAEKDSIIAGKKYVVVKKYVTQGSALFQSIFRQEGIYRDSAGFNITPHGTFFNQGDFESVTISPIPGGSIEFQLKSSSTIYTPYGPYPNTINYLGKFQPLNLSYSSTRYLNNYFSNGIGLVQSTGFYVNDPNHFYENNLIRYKIF